jgi:hypothetical protein
MDILLHDHIQQSASSVLLTHHHCPILRLLRSLVSQQHHHIAPWLLQSPDFCGLTLRKGLGVSLRWDTLSQAMPLQESHRRGYILTTSHLGAHGNGCSTL